MSAPSIAIVPQTSVKINKMIQEVMTISNNERRSELDHFLTASRSVESEIMATTLSGLIMKADA